MEEKRQRAKKIEVPERGLSDKNVSRRRPASKQLKNVRHRKRLKNVRRQDGKNALRQVSWEE